MFSNPLGAISLIFLAAFSVRSENKGLIQSCDPALYQFSLAWTPQTFQSGVTYTISLSTVAAKTFARGRLCLKVWLHGNQYPIYDDCRTIQCQDILKEARRYTNHILECPIAPGSRINVANFEYTIDPTVPLPGGHFHVNATLDNENNERFLCVMGDVDISDDFDEDF